MSEISTTVRLNAEALITPGPDGPSGFLIERRGRGGGGVKAKSKICAYLDSSDIATLTFATRSDKVSCGGSERCAFSASYVGCVTKAVTSSVNHIVPTACVGPDAWESELSMAYSAPGTLLCSDWSEGYCQTIHFLQSNVTFTGFTCMPTNASAALTATGGSWSDFAPTSIPTPINQLYHIAINTTLDTTSTAVETAANTGSSGAVALTAQCGTVQLTGLIMIVTFMLHLF